MKENNSQNWQAEPSEAQQQSLIDLYHQRKFNEVVSQTTQLLEQFPNSVFLLNILGAGNTNLGQLDAAVANFEQIIAINPNFTDAYLNLGIILKNKGDLAAAASNFEQVIKINPNYIHAYLNLGDVLRNLGKLDAAIAIYEQALEIKPDFTEVRCKMGEALEEQGALDAAIASYKQSITTKQDYVVAYYNLGNALWKRGEIEAAIANLKKAIKIKPNLIAAYFSLFQVLDKSNRINELSLTFEEAKIQFDNLPVDLKYYEALMLYREGKYEDALNILNSLTPSGSVEFMLPAFFKLKGECSDKLKKFDEAFQYFNKMNETIKSSKSFQKYSPNEYFNFYRDQLKQIQSSPYKPHIISKKSIKAHEQAFLVGFPRSGTTLLDTILRSHSRICVVEEKPMISSAKKSIGMYNDLKKKENLSYQEISTAKQAYYAELEKHITGPKNDYLIIDRLPLNIFEMPLIHSLFPESVIIQAVRHPLDSILSCWMQNFQLSHSMANMVGLERIVDLYCLSMDTLKACKSRYNLTVHMIRYEDIVYDLKTELTALLQFLGLEWEDQLENYRDTALKRGRIDTASFRQVIRPLYKESVFRWENYRKHFENYLHKIEPWVNEFGYEL